MADAHEISVQFGVSLQAAEVCFDRLTRKAERQREAARVRKSADEAIELLRPKKPPQTTYLDASCGSCHMATLIPVGTKVLCDTCGFLGDRFQDGDGAG